MDADKRCRLCTDCQKPPEQVPSKECDSPPFTVDRYGSFGAAVTAERDWLRRENVRWENAHKILLAENERLKRLIQIHEQDIKMWATQADEWKAKATAPEPAAESALRNCLLLAMRNLHVKHPDSLAAKNWEAIVRFCKEGGVEPSPLRAAQPPGDG